MTTTVMPEISHLDSPNYLSETCSDDKSSIFLFNNSKCKNFYRSPKKNQQCSDHSHNSIIKHQKLSKKDSKSAPVSITNTPDWQRKKQLKNDKSKSKLVPNQANNKLVSNNSSEHSFLAIDCNLNKANVNYSYRKNSISNCMTKTEDSKFKTCCLCWCCCCTFSCLNVHSSSEDSSRPQISNDLTSRIDTIINEEKLNVDLVNKWAESFESLIQSTAGQRVFREFLKLEYSEENILFYLACEDLKNETVPDIVEEKARFIYEDYISILSPKEVSLDSRVREIINDNMVEPTAFTFDEAQLQIYILMHRDSYPRFLNSKLYKDLLIKLKNGLQV